MAFIFSDSILLPSTQEDAMVEGAEDHTVSHHANQGGAVKTQVWRQTALSGILIPAGCHPSPNVSTFTFKSEHGLEN